MRSLSTQQIILASLVLLDTERTPSFQPQVHTLQAPRGFPPPRTMPTLLSTHMQDRICYGIQHIPHPKRRGAGPRGTFCSGQSWALPSAASPSNSAPQLASTRCAFPHRWTLVFCRQNGVLKLLPARRCSRGWILCADRLQGSLPIARSRRFKEHLPARRARGGEERRGQLRVCPGLLLPNGRDPCPKGSEWTRLWSKRFAISARGPPPLGAGGEDGVQAQQPEGGRAAGLPAPAGRLRLRRPPAAPTRRAAGLRGAGGARPVLPGGAPRDPPAARARRREAFRGRKPPEVIFLNRLFCLFKVRWQEKRRPKYNPPLIRVFSKMSDYLRDWLI